MVYQRFYKRVPVLDSGAPGWCPVGSAARACLLLGCKLEERAVPIARLLDAFYATDVACDPALQAAVAAGRLPRHLVPEDPAFWSAKQDTVRTESVVLAQLGFMVDVETPLKPLASYARVLRLPDSVLRRALAVCNDLLRTDAVARFRAQEVACAGIYVGARLAGVALPERECEAGPWWALFDVDEARLLCVVAQAQRLFTWARRRGVGNVADN